MLKELLLGIGVLGLAILLCIIILLPLICTIILGVAFANMLGLTGIVWWAFVILFYIIIMGIISLII